MGENNGINIGHSNKATADNAGDRSDPYFPCQRRIETIVLTLKF